MHNSYGYRPYFLRDTRDGHQWLLPLMEVKSWLTGNRAVALPFTDRVPVGNGANGAREELLEQCRVLGKSRGWKTVEVRCGELAGQEAAQYFGHLLELPDNEGSCFDAVSGNHRRNIRKAAKAGVQVQIDNSPAGMERFYRLNALTRKRHGLPPQPRRFFREIQQGMLDCGLGHIGIATHNGRDLAANIYLHFNDQVVYKYGAADLHQSAAGASTLLMWEMIRFFIGEGYRQLDFGRTDLHHDGLRRFKSGWGATEQPFSYLRINIKNGRQIRDSASQVSGRHNAVFRLMPVTVLELAGRLLYRHMG
ncbi:MAG TPA: GNAT family N-acetyltransferase [Calditrichia bacterium]|nr:GNAT family N-acetyltransferase [Calditrichia bacterium]HQV30535.1 GNAT family N-acetyltransferase [Calditrichia bacterium]